MPMTNRFMWSGTMAGRHAPTRGEASAGCKRIAQLPNRVLRGAEQGYPHLKRRAGRQSASGCLLRGEESASHKTSALQAVAISQKAKNAAV